MRVFRIEREKYLKQTLQGVGAALSEGFRWNSLSTYMVYTAQSRSLAMLEIAMHLDLSEDLPNDRYFVEIEIPKAVSVLALQKSDLPEAWDAKPPLVETQNIGDEFVLRKEAAVLRVPSAIIHEEFNYLINPNHSESSKIKVVSTKLLQFDNRLSQNIKY